MQLDFAPAETFRGTSILRQANNLAYAYETEHKAVDADGAPNAYHPQNTGLDDLANAGYPNHAWWRDVLVTDPQNHAAPYVQPAGQFSGYFVSMTSLRSPNGHATDSATYVDATRVPYVVIPSGFEHLPHIARVGDVGFAVNLQNDLSMAFIVADTGGGSDARLGEASIAFFTALGGNQPNPRNGHGVPSGPIQYILFPGSRRQGAQVWPRTQADIESQVQQLLLSTPGIHWTGV